MFTGEMFESEMYGVIKKNFDADSFSYEVGSEMDYCKGTDFIIMGVPIDFTSDFAQKDNTIVLRSEYYLPSCGLTVQFGVRTGNTHNEFHKFEIPVLVVGVTALPRFVNTWIDVITKDFMKNINEIMDMGMDSYWTWCDEAGIEF